MVVWARSGRAGPVRASRPSSSRGGTPGAHHRPAREDKMGLRASSTVTPRSSRTAGFPPTRCSGGAGRRLQAGDDGARRRPDRDRLPGLRRGPGRAGGRRALHQGPPGVRSRRWQTSRRCGFMLANIQTELAAGRAADPAAPPTSRRGRPFTREASMAKGVRLGDGQPRRGQGECSSTEATATWTSSRWSAISATRGCRPSTRGPAEIQRIVIARESYSRQQAGEAMVSREAVTAAGSATLPPSGRWRSCRPRPPVHVLPPARGPPPPIRRGDRPPGPGPGARAGTASEAGPPTFWICPACGVYRRRAGVESEGRRYGVVNVRALDEAKRFTQAPAPMVYDAETPGERLGRRARV